MSSSVLSVRLSKEERELLEAASSQARTNVSDFVRRKAIEAAEMDVLDRRIVTIPAKDWERFEAWAARPARAIPALEGACSQAADMAEVTPPRPLAEDDERSHFDCGRGSLKAWFQRHAWQNHVGGISRTSVIFDERNGRIVGYVTLSAAQIERGFLAKSDQRNKRDPVPGTLLGQLAVDRNQQSRGHARSLLLFALTTALVASRDIGSFGVITYPLDGPVREFYRRWGFQDVPFDPRRSMIVRMVDLVKSGFTVSSSIGRAERI
jgi:uncharacterized protein (DUF1778 family)